MLKTLMLSAALLGAAAAPSFAQMSPTTPPPSNPSIATAPATVDAMKGTTIIGTDIKNSADETIGEIDDVVVDSDGKIQHVVVSVGGFLGVGTRYVAVPWSDIRFDRGREVALLNMTKDQLKAAPEYKYNRAEAPARTMPAPGAVPAPVPPRTAN